jgi:two-component system, probable response regulator PhcQ
VKPRVMFVDDEPRITAALKRFLIKDRYDILTAASASEALEQLKEGEVDVVVSDEMMPGMNGLEFLSIVKEKYPNTIRIILTGCASLELLVRAINDCSIYHFLAKPCNKEHLSLVIRRAIQERRILIQSQRMLAALRRQSDIIANLEIDQPGITAVEKDEEGVISISDSPADIDQLLVEMEEAVDEATSRFDDKAA